MIRVRPATESDHAAVREVNRAAFGRNDEADLVEALRADGDVILELVADSQSAVIGHILFSRLALEQEDGTVTSAAALAPMAVLPEHQRQAVGSELVEAGLAACRKQGTGAIVVLGWPEFYPRFGFTAEAAEPLQAPFSGEAFMALELIPRALKPGRLRYARAFRLD